MNASETLFWQFYWRSKTIRLLRVISHGFAIAGVTSGVLGDIMGLLFHSTHGLVFLLILAGGFMACSFTCNRTANQWGQEST